LTSCWNNIATSLPQVCYTTCAFLLITDFVNFQWKENQTRLGMQGSLVMTAIKQQLDVIMSAQQKAPETKCIESLFTKLSGSFDETHGGFGGAPRFPQPSTFLEDETNQWSHKRMRRGAVWGGG
jgi:uncharacterized protein YyaL (SSP411 family)